MCVCVCSGTLCVCVCLVLCGGGSRIVMWCACVGKRVWGGARSKERGGERARRVGRRRVCAACVCVKKKRRARAVGGDEGMAVEACVLGSVERSAQESAVERRERSGGGARERERKESSVGSLRVE